MAQVDQPKEQMSAANSDHKALCPFYGSSHGCPYMLKCTMSHANPNSIELCPAYQTIEGCCNPTTCYYRHCLPPLSSQEIGALQRKHKIAGKVQYTLSVKGKSVHRVHILINQVIWYAVHFIIEDDRLQHIHHQKYSSIYRFNDAILVAEFIANVLNRSPTPGKYLSFLKNLIDGDTEPGKEDEDDSNHNGDGDGNGSKSLIHYRDILSSIGQKFDEIPRPVNPHLVKNLTRVPWTDFKLMSLPLEAFDYPDIYLKPGDLVRVWRPKKFVFHCGIYLGQKRIIHISNGMDDGVGGKLWGSFFQSGSAPSECNSNASPFNAKYYDYGKKLRDDILQQKMQEMTESQLMMALCPQKNNHDDDDDDGDDDADCGFEQIEKSEIEVYGDDDDMDLEGDSDDEGNESRDDQKMSELVMTSNLSGEEKPDQIKRSDLLYQDMSEENLQQEMTAQEMEQARRARECDWTEFVANSRKKDLELGYFVFPWRKPSEIVYTAKFLTEIHYMKGQYSVFKNNCEHFALYCCTGLRYSPQANAIEKITTPMIDVASKITSFAGSLLSKVVSLRKSPKHIPVEEKENENRKNHPVLQERPLDDGGDDELEKILLDDNSSQAVFAMSDCKQKGKRESPILFGKRKRRKRKSSDSGFILAEDLCSEVAVQQREQCPPADEYENDEEDELAESMIMESNIEVEAAMMDMTPGGLSMSEVMVAQKHHRKWNV